MIYSLKVKSHSLMIDRSYRSKPGYKSGGPFNSDTYKGHKLSNAWDPDSHDRFMHEQMNPNEKVPYLRRNKHKLALASVVGGMGLGALGLHAMEKGRGALGSAGIISGLGLGAAGLGNLVYQGTKDRNYRSDVIKKMKDAGAELPKESLLSKVPVIPLVHDINRARREKHIETKLIDLKDKGLL